MNKRIIVLFFCVMSVLSKLAMAGPVDENTARNIASSFMHTRVAGALTRVQTACPHLYVFNAENGGFVVVSSDDRVRPVLAYSTTGRFDPSDMPPALVEMLRSYEWQLAAIADGADVQPYYRTGGTRAVAPLVTSQWSQAGQGYNAYCPEDTSLASLGGHPTVGCTALALAQVMRYWQWPARGRGVVSYSYSYPCWTYGTLTEDFSTVTFDWSNMPDSLTDSSTQVQRDAVGQFLYSCALACTARFNDNCEGATGIYETEQHYAAVRNFNYDANSLLCERANYPDSIWTAMLMADLDAQRPVLYSGYSEQDSVAGTRSGGHSFVIDGYDSQGLFHLNWGWAGRYDAYYAIDLLTPAAYNFSHTEKATFGLQPGQCENAPFTELLGDLILDTAVVQRNETLSGHVDMVNIGDCTDDFFVAQAIVENNTQQFVRWVDVQHLQIAAGDTLHYTFNAPIDVPVGSYFIYMLRSGDSIDINAVSLLGTSEFMTEYETDVDVWVVDTNRSELTNLVIFVRFADDEEITHSFAAIDSMFNCEEEGCFSVYNFYNALTYDKIHFRSIYTNNIQNGQIVSFVDSHPRAYYEPFGDTNPIGYEGEAPEMGVHPRMRDLLYRSIRYVDSLQLVDQYVTLDGDGDGRIDNLSFIVKGGIGNWNSLLWPQMEYFPQDSVDQPAVINGKEAYAFNFEFEGAGAEYFSAHVFRHEMGHSLDLPDLYHYNEYLYVKPALVWDMMDYNFVFNQTAAIYKNKILHVSDDPIQITEDGDYTLLSVGSSASQNCYYIKSAIDSTQWYLLEFRNQNDPFESGIPGTGLLVARWNDTVTLDYNGMYANSFFDYYNQAHQYWIFRPGSAIDTVNGNIFNAHFSYATGRTAFGPTTDPHPYLTDGTPENSFEITDIREYDDHLTFHVHFFTDGVAQYQNMADVLVYPNPTTDRLTLEGQDMQRVDLYDAMGRLISHSHADSERITVSMVGMPAGLYLLKVMMKDGSVVVRKVVKK